jgi:hypothetical protein
LQVNKSRNLKNHILKTNTYYFHIFLLIVFSSCSTLKFSKNTDAIEIDKENYTKVNGNYDNNFVDTSTTLGITLWNILNAQNNVRDYNKALIYRDAKVSLFFKNDKTLYAKLYNADTVIAEKFFKGKFKNGFFLGKRKIKYFGLPFIYMTYSQYRFRIGKDKSNNLLVDKAEERFGWIFIFSAGTNFSNNYKFAAVGK